MCRLLAPVLTVNRLLFFFFSFSFAAAIYRTTEVNKAVIKQSILLRCLWIWYNMWCHYFAVAIGTTISCSLGSQYGSVFSLSFLDVFDAEFHVLFLFMLNVTMLSFIMLKTQKK